MRGNTSCIAIYTVMGLHGGAANYDPTYRYPAYYDPIYYARKYYARKYSGPTYYAPTYYYRKYYSPTYADPCSDQESVVSQPSCSLLHVLRVVPPVRISVPFCWCGEHEAAEIPLPFIDRRSVWCSGSTKMLVHHLDVRESCNLDSVPLEM